MMDQATELLNQGIAAVRAGKPDEARTLLMAALKANPRSEQAWLWLSGVVGNRAQQRDCLQRALEINPASAAARRGLERLAADEPTAAGPSSAPAGASTPQPAQPNPTPPQAEQAPAPDTTRAQTIAPPPPPPLQPAGNLYDAEQQLSEVSLSPDLPEQAGALQFAESQTGIPAHATLPPPLIAACYFCSTPDVSDVCSACQQPQSYDCPRCGLPIELRTSDTCKCGESLRSFLRPDGVEHERLGDRYLKERYVAAAIKQWEMAIPHSSKPQALHRKLANAYLDVGLVDKAREHEEAARPR